MKQEAKPYQVLFDYTDTPTVKKFTLDDTRMRCIMGPFGSGKTSGCVMEMIRRANLQVLSPDGVRRTRWAVVRNCYDDQTEILTEKRGWKLFKDLLPDDKVASLINDKELVFVTPTNYFSSTYSGEMIGYKNRSVDFLVTPDHHLYASMFNGRTKERYGYRLHKASDIFGMTHYHLKVNADAYNGGESEYPEKLFEFFGFWFAEGSISKNVLVVVQKGNEYYIRQLMDGCGFSYGRSEKRDKDGNKNGCFNYRVHTSERVRELVRKLSICGKARDKYLPMWIKNAPREHLKAFLFGFEMGDGHTRLHKNDSTRLYTSSEQLANDLQEIIIKAGGHASLNKSKAGKKHGDVGNSFPGQGYMFILNIHQKNQYTPQTLNKDGWYKKDYDGMVYCVEVPSHVVLVRRCNKIIWLGQTYKQLLDTTIRTVHYWFPPKIFGEYHVTNHNYYITKFPGVQIELCYRALDREEHVSNLLSFEFTHAFFNEVREIPWSIIDAMDGRIGRYPPKEEVGDFWHGMIMDTNPPEEGSKLYKIAEEIQLDNFKMFKQPSGLSPHAENTTHLQKNYYKNLAKGKDEMFVRVYVHGQYGFILTGKPVFQSFIDSVHVAPHVLEPMKGIDLICGFDFGLQPAVSIGQITPLGQLRILDELVSDGMGIKQFCENQLLPLLRQKYFGYNVMGFGDPSGTSRTPTDETTCFDILHSQEIGLRNVEPAPTNAIVPRVGAVEFFLGKMVNGEPGFLLSPNCTYLRKAMNGGYYYEKDPKSKSGDETKPMPVKNFSSHVADSLQMLCMYIQERETSNKKMNAFLDRIKRKTPYRTATMAGY